ncbi:hypothetical protein GCM10009858_44710 [Terrabacter carboxydivorans]|uniref:Uncharacterized protein n=1 Tax=Terrabacter carboxydivorans TaxID=619730 RepID=A0ABP5ZQB8_9MICO
MPALLYTDTFPVPDTFEMIVFAVVTPDAMLSCDRFAGRASSDGHTIRYEAADGDTAVTVIATAETPEDGTPAVPVAWNDADPPGPKEAATPNLDRVSTTRVGVTAMNSPAAGAVAASAARGVNTCNPNEPTSATIATPEASTRAQRP